MFDFVILHASVTLGVITQAVCADEACPNGDIWPAILGCSMVGLSQEALGLKGTLESLNLRRGVI